MKRSKFRPFKQGYLDGLCGIYSVINATKYIVGNISEEGCSDLFYRCLDVMEQEKGVLSIMLDGVNGQNLNAIFNNVVCSQFNIVKKKPFHKNRRPPLDHYWSTIQRFLESDEKRAVVLTVGGADWSHWTVVYSATAKQLKLLDSDGMRVVKRIHCTTRDSRKAGYLLYPTQTYFLSGGNDES